jgi:hypothetical protein
MQCTQCGAPATVKRGEHVYCGSCSINRDWQYLIQLVQDATVETPVAGAGTTVPKSA